MIMHFIIASTTINNNNLFLNKERVFSVELHLCMKGYCWPEFQAKIVAIVKTKM